MTILLDCDVLLDVATARAPFASESGLALDWCERNPGRGFVAWHTVANTYYLLRKSQSDDSAREFIRELLTFVEVVATGTAHARHALTLPLKDF